MKFSQSAQSLATGWLVLIAGFAWKSCVAFVPRTATSSAWCPPNLLSAQPRTTNNTPKTRLHMGLDLVTYLRTEWVSAALCTNQTPRSADVCLQLGCEDGRAITFIPRTVRELVTSSAEVDGQVKVAVKRQLKQQQERRKAAKVSFLDQRADDLKETADDSVDVVISLQAAARMLENGLEWKKSIREAARVLKPGGRLLFVEQSSLNGESYLDYVMGLASAADDCDEQGFSDDNDTSKENGEEAFPMFEVGFDEVDLVLTPHVAGVAIKSEDAGLTAAERARKEQDEEKSRIADLSITAYERGIKKRKKKKKKAKSQPEDAKAAGSS